MVTDVLFATANVVTVKLAEVWPPGTLTMPGASGNGRLLVASVTEMPPAGAGALKNTVPVAFVPPLTVVGLIVIDCRSGGAFGSGLTLTKMDFVTPPAVAKTFPPVGVRLCAGSNSEAGGAVSFRDGDVAGTCMTRGIIGR